MTKESKNRKNKFKDIDQSKIYNPLDAIKILKDVSYVKFDESLDDEVRVEDSPGVRDFASKDYTGEEENYNSEAAFTKGVNNVKISENMESINHSDQKSGKYKVILSKTHQNSEKHNSLKDVKFDLELKTKNEASVINTDSPSRSSISELKKELMSLSELIKSTPAKVKNSTEVKNP